MTVLEKYEDRNTEDPDLTKAEEIVFGILDELNGRKGILGIDQCDEEIQEEILESLVQITNNNLNDA